MEASTRSAFTKDSLATLGYRDLQKLAKQQGIKASGKADDIRGRLEGLLLAAGTEMDAIVRRAYRADSADEGSPTVEAAAPPSPDIAPTAAPEPTGSAAAQQTMTHIPTGASHPTPSKARTAAAEP